MKGTNFRNSYLYNHFSVDKYQHPLETRKQSKYK